MMDGWNFVLVFSKNKLKVIWGLYFESWFSPT